MFWISLRSFVTARDRKTGTIVAQPPSQIEAIAFPFDTILDEAARVANAIQEGISVWGKDIREAGVRLLEASTAQKQAFASTALLIFQVLVTIMSVAAVFVGFMFPEWISGRKDAAVARTQLEAAQREREGALHERDQLARERERVLRERDQLTRERDDQRNENDRLRMQLQEALKQRR